MVSLNIFAKFLTKRRLLLKLSSLTDAVPSTRKRRSNALLKTKRKEKATRRLVRLLPNLNYSPIRSRLLAFPRLNSTRGLPKIRFINVSLTIDHRKCWDTKHAPLLKKKNEIDCLTIFRCCQGKGSGQIPNGLKVFFRLEMKPTLIVSTSSNLPIVLTCWGGGVIIM